VATPSHVPVLLDRVVSLLAPALDRDPGDREATVLVDATLGLGGHSEAVLAAFPRTRVVGIDRDPQALALATERLVALHRRARRLRRDHRGAGAARAG
jgi:16S rRNA (cytosine1402-N4)-methyltransferase